MEALIDLSERVALITGGSRGIGAAAAKLLAQAGARVAITYQQRKAEAERVVGEIEKLGDGKRETGKVESGDCRAIAIQADLRTGQENDRAIEATLKAFGRLDTFVASAGIWPPEPVGLREMSDEQWRQSVATNLDAVFYGCRAALRVMKPGSTIVIVSSTAGQRGEAFHADYAASKG
ncbi:MAG: SDR family oxidoreductase, partial [Gemmatimonadetes bacterium]|nr:SDR family oxidoreductase [Gemmatimonadota bacterium]